MGSGTTTTPRRRARSNSARSKQVAVFDPRTQSLPACAVRCFRAPSAPSSIQPLLLACRSGCSPTSPARVRKLVISEAGKFSAPRVDGLSAYGALRNISRSVGVPSRIQLVSDTIIPARDGAACDAAARHDAMSLRGTRRTRRRMASGPVGKQHRGIPGRHVGHHRLNRGDAERGGAVGVSAKRAQLFLARRLHRDASGVTGTGRPWCAIPEIVSRPGIRAKKAARRIDFAVCHPKMAQRSGAEERSAAAHRRQHD